LRPKTIQSPNLMILTSKLELSSIIFFKKIKIKIKD